MINVSVGKATLMTDGEAPYIYVKWEGKSWDYAFWSYSGNTRESARKAAPALAVEYKRTGNPQFWIRDWIDDIRKIDGSDSADYFSGELWLETFKERCEEALIAFGDLAMISWDV